MVVGTEPRGEAGELEPFAGQRAQELLDVLSAATWRVGRAVPRDPELRKLLGRIHTAIREARRIEAESEAGLGAGRARATQLLEVDPRGMSIDAVLELIDGWDQLLIEHGDSLYVSSLLIAEHTRDQQQTTSATWSGVFGAVPAAGWDKVAVGERLTDSERDEAVHQLAGLYRARSILYDLERARRQMQVRYLWLLTPVIAILVIGLVLAMSARMPGAPLPIVIVAGALGASVSGARKLRDEVPNINALRAFAPAIVVQPLLGAAAGLLLLLALESGLLGLETSGEGWALAGALAFAAGFSEPVFLGVVARIATIGEPTTGGQPGT